MKLPDLLPVSWRSGMQESWGRLSALSPLGARLESLEPPAADRLFLSFQLSAEAFTDIPCGVTEPEPDPDGYSRAGLEFLRPQDRRRLRESIARILLTAR